MPSIKGEWHLKPKVNLLCVLLKIINIIFEIM